MKIKSIIYAIALIFMPFTVSAKDLDQKIIQYAKTGVLSIKTRINHSAYEDNDEYYGTGFIIDKNKGLILTNNHVVGTAAAATFELTFFNGIQTDALLMYQDPWQDFAILKVDPNVIPSKANQLALKPSQLEINQQIFVAGKNEGKDFSLHTGYITGLYETIGFLTGQSIALSLNARGGASGSPVINEKGDVIALIHSSDYDTTAYALPIDYVADALVSIGKNTIPPRKHTGMLMEYLSINYAVKFLSLPEKYINEYSEKYPSALNKLIWVSSIFPDSPAYNKLHVGDIIWTVNKQEIGPNLYQLDKLMNNSSQDKVTITVFRSGQFIDVDVELYNLNHSQIQKMVSFGGAIFYQADDYTRRISGANKGKLFVSNVLPGSSFHRQFPGIPGTNKLLINIVKMDGKPINSLDDLIKIIPHLIQKKDFTVSFINYATHQIHGQELDFSQTERITTVTYNKLDSAPELLNYDNKAFIWDAKTILSDN